MHPPDSVLSSLTYTAFVPRFAEVAAFKTAANCMGVSRPLDAGRVVYVSKRQVVKPRLCTSSSAKYGDVGSPRSPCAQRRFILWDTGSFARKRVVLHRGL